MHLAGNASILVVVGAGGAQVVAGAMSVGELTSFLMYSLYLGFASSSLSSLYAELSKAAGAVERVARMAGRQPLLPAEGGAAPACENVKGEIVFENVGFAYGGNSASDGTSGGDVSQREPHGTGSERVLSSLSLHIHPGERVGLVGRSGCGKSTALRLLSRLYDPVRSLCHFAHLVVPKRSVRVNPSPNQLTSIHVSTRSSMHQCHQDCGSISLDGTDLKDLDPRWLRAVVGVVYVPLLQSRRTLANAQLVFSHHHTGVTQSLNENRNPKHVQSSRTSFVLRIGVRQH